jgi:hypothetical protein
MYVSLMTGKKYSSQSRIEQGGFFLYFQWYGIVRLRDTGTCRGQVFTAEYGGRAERKREGAIAFSRHCGVAAQSGLTLNGAADIAG